MDTAICIFKTSNSTEADLLKSKLEAYGVLCFLQSDNAGGCEPSLTFVNGVSIMVHKDQEKEARNILKNS